MQSLIEQLLISARLAESQAPIDQEIDLVESVCEIISDYTPLAIECDRKIALEAPDLPVTVKANRRAIECILGNLLSNALRAEPSGGTIVIVVTPAASISVVDHGPGLAPSQRALAFEPFWRADEGSPGTGLGLSITKELVEKQNGKISIEESPGGGATFKLQFSVQTG
jgi:signal transduction histidine kinase